MKTLLLVSRNEEIIKELRAIVHPDWILWDVANLEAMRDLLPSLTVDVGIIDIGTLGSHEASRGLLKQLPDATSWIGLVSEAMSLEEAAPLAPFFLDLLHPPLNPSQVQWSLQKGRDRNLHRRLELTRSIGMPVGATPSQANLNATSSDMPGGDRGSLERALLFSRPLTAGRDRNRLLQLFLEAVVESFGVNRVSLLLFHDDAQVYTVVASHGLRSEIVSRIRLKGDEGLARWLAMKGRILRREHLWADRQDPILAEVLHEMEVLGCVIGIPMWVQGRLVGILALDEKLTGTPYSLFEMERLFTLSNHLAEAVWNMRPTGLTEVATAGKQEAQPEAETPKHRDARILDELVGGLAHELRNPLVAVRTFTQLLKDRYEDPELREFFYSTVSGEVERLNQLIERLTTFVQPLEYHFESVAMDGLIHGAEASMLSSAKKQGVRITRKVALGSRGTVRADRTQLGNALRYLLEYATRSMSAGGLIQILADASADTIRVTLEMTGPGFPSDDLKRILDPVYAAGQPSGGMGLILSQRILEDHGGGLRIESPLHPGAVFVIELPIANGIRGGLHVGEEERSGYR